MSTIIITTLIGLVLAAYGWIFRTVLKRIDKIEKKQETSNEIFLRIETALAAIKTDLEWIKKQK